MSDKIEVKPGDVWKYEGRDFTMVGRRLEGDGWWHAMGGWFDDLSFSRGHLTLVSRAAPVAPVIEVGRTKCLAWCGLDKNHPLVNAHRTPGRAYSALFLLGDGDHRRWCSFACRDARLPPIVKPEAGPPTNPEPAKGQRWAIYSGDGAELTWSPVVLRSRDQCAGQWFVTLNDGSQGFVIDEWLDCRDGTRAVYLGDEDDTVANPPAPAISPSDIASNPHAHGDLRKPAPAKVEPAKEQPANRCDRGPCKDRSAPTLLRPNGRYWCEPCMLAGEANVADLSASLEVERIKNGAWAPTVFPHDRPLPRPAPLACDEGLTWSLLPDGGR